MKKLALVLLVSFTAIAATADTWTDDRGFTWSYYISGNEATITGISPKEGEMPPIPSELGGVPVTSIGGYAFNGCSGLTGALKIPDSVTSIWYNAFSSCSGLTGSLTIGDSVTSIGSGAFYGCSGFTGSLTIGGSVTNIGNGAFQGCSGFTGSLMIPDSVMSIESQAFYGCNGFAGSLTIGGSVTSIGDRAFQGCSGFTGSLTIGGSVTSIGSQAFSGCSGFTGSLTIGGNRTSIGYRAFSGCSGFTGSLTICDSVTSIGNEVFYGCRGFTGLSMMSDSVTSIGSGAFAYCYGFTGIYVDGITSWTGISFEDEYSNPLRYAHNLYIKGSLVEGKLIIPDGVTYVGGFYGCTGLKEIELPNTVTNICNRAFQDCTELVNMNMPTNIKVIGEYAFSGCHKLLKLSWLPGVKVGKYAFQNCKSWQGGFDVPVGVSEIADGTFMGCSGLQKIQLPESVTMVGREAFRSCSSLEVVNLPEGVLVINDYTFANCSLKNFTIPSTVQTIGMHAFDYCPLTEITIPHGVTAIYTQAFYGTSIKSLILPSTLVNTNDGWGLNGISGTITFSGDLPVGYESWIGINNMVVSFPRNSGNRGFVTWPVTQFMGYTQENAPVVTIVSSKIRENDPEVLDVVYKVTSTKPTVKVRALAFENGVRSFANVVRPEDFIADINGNETSGNVGDAVTANEEHTLSWKVSSDWATRLAKVSFEVLATEDDILPLELMTIPGTASHPETWQVSWNYITADKSFEALLWLYADKDLGLTLQNGVLKNGDTRLCSGASVSAYDALVYIYGKMGFQLLDGDALSYVKEATRFNLPDKSSRQYAYRVVTDE